MKEVNYTNRLRNWLGLLGILLPVSSLVFNLIFGSGYNPPGFLTSISATHYSSSYLFFEGLVFGVGLFLLCYEGYDIKDRIYSVIAGSGAIVLTLFPCGLNDGINRNFLMLPMNLTAPFHFVGAGAFFISLFFIIFFQFTKTGEKPIDKNSKFCKKWVRNIIYRICGITMISALIIGFTMPNFNNWPYWVFAGEWLALWAFGFAWLVKGGIIWKDLNSL